jgi:phenylalanyl-tRNA synthetase beta chain
MPTVQFDTGEVVGMLEKKASIDLLRGRIPMMGVDLVRLDEDVLEMEVFPNRPDMLCVEGFVRALRGFLGLESGVPPYLVSDSALELLIDPSVSKVRPFAVAAAAYNLSVTEDFLVSIMNVQEKLHLTHGRNRVKVAIGIHDLDKVKSPFTYKAVLPSEISFVPLDMDREMDLACILKEHPKGREYAFAVMGSELYPVIVDGDGSVLSFPPIINGELTRVTRQTENLLIEVTGKSELAVNSALNIIATAFADRGGKIASVEIKNKK